MTRAASDGSLRKKSDRAPRGEKETEPLSGKEWTPQSRGQPAHPPHQLPGPSRSIGVSGLGEHRAPLFAAVSMAGFTPGLVKTGETQLPYETHYFCERLARVPPSVPLPQARGSLERVKGLLGLLSKANVSTAWGISPTDDSQRTERGTEEMKWLQVAGCG